jgi:hypothetical protein
MTDSNPTIEDDDIRTPEQHMADVAAYTLARLAGIDEDMDYLTDQLADLADWAADDEPHLRHHPFLDDVANRLDTLRFDVPDAVRDIAATLPVRGVDYGVGA